MTGNTFDRWPEPMIASGDAGRALRDRRPHGAERDFRPCPDGAGEEVIADAASRVIVAGPTNNGGHSARASRMLREAGRNVVVGRFGGVADLTGDPARAAERWTGPTVPARRPAKADTELRMGFPWWSQSGGDGRTGGNRPAIPMGTRRKVLTSATESRGRPDAANGILRNAPRSHNRDKLLILDGEKTS